MTLPVWLNENGLFLAQTAARMGAGLMLTLMLLAPAAAQAPDTHPSANATTAANATPTPVQTLSTAESESESEKVADTMRLTFKATDSKKGTNFTIVDGTKTASFFVDWGDGVIESKDLSPAWAPVFNHTYTNNGSYKIKVYSGQYKNTQNPNPDSIPRITMFRMEWGYTAVDATGVPYLIELNCNTNDLQSLDVSGLAYLPTLTAHGAYDTIKMRNCPALETVVLNGSSKYLDFSDCEKLNKVTAYNNNPNLISNRLTYLNMSNCKSVKEIKVGDINTRFNLAYLNVSGCTALTKLDCRNNQLKSLDVSTCTELTELFCYTNQLTNLNVKGCTKLNFLSCGDNKLESLDASGCEALTIFYCHYNQLTYLNVSRCAALQQLYCYTNPLPSLNVEDCAHLKILSCFGNKLSSLDVSNHSNLLELWAYSNPDMTTLNVSGCIKLQKLSCAFNKQLQSLDVSSCADLIGLYCYECKLKSLDVSHNTKLSGLECFLNQLEQLKIGQNTALTYLYCRNNQLESLDVSGCTALTSLYCQDNQLRDLKLYDGSAKLTEFCCYNNHLPLSMLYPFMARRPQNAYHKLSPQTDSKELSSRLVSFDLKSEITGIGDKRTKWSVAKFDGSAVAPGDVVETGGEFVFQKGQYRLMLENDLVRQKTTTSTGAADNSTVVFTWMVDVKNEVYDIRTLSANVKWGEVPERGGLYEGGKEVTIRAIPKTGYRFLRWENVITGKEFSKNNVHKFPATQDLTLIAYFEEATYDITVQANNADWGEVDGSGIYRENADVIITATPKEGYRFVKWVDVLAGLDFSTKAIHKFKAGQDLHLTAIFEEIPLYTIAVEPNRTEWGSASGSGTYKEDSVVYITATAQEGYHFVCWRKGSEVFSKMMRHSFKAQEHITLTAEFEAVPEDAIRVRVQSNGFSMGSASITGDGIYKPGDSVTIRATANIDHRFVNWMQIKGADKKEFSTQADTTFKVTENMEIWAYFRNVPPHTITVQANNANWGEVSGGGNRVPENADVTITATPKEGYRFVDWKYIDRGSQLEVFSKSSDTTFKATQNIAITAYFEEILYHIIAKSDSAEMGSVSGTGTYKENATVVLTATPKPGFRFIEWKNGDKEVSFEEKYEFPATEDMTLTAYFAEVPSHMVSLSTNNVEWGEVSGGGAYKENTEITIKAEAKKGGKFVNWKIGEEVFTTKTDTTFKVMEDINLVACFEEDASIKYYTIKVRSNDPVLGKAMLSTGVDSARFVEGTEVTIVAAPQVKNSFFVNWLLTDENTGSSTEFCSQLRYTFKATQDLALTAVFHVEDCDGVPYVQDRVIYLSKPMGKVQLIDALGHTLYEGNGVAIPVSSKGAYILRIDSCNKNHKVLVP